ncbi:MAG: PEP-CTERM sorting domain-containing protein [Burkholderiaceae bacterium]|nr:PEP-CTERM sorting domain-containing protein [Burkholderiaceae bacterium]MDH3459827.1 PEP-CTERM sorting domain-containing protein [Burkholderiaceae bacterium]
MRLSLLSIAIGALASVPAYAVPTTVNYNVDFSSPTQSFWGPGKSASNFGINKLLLGNTTFGLRFQTGASTGTVKSNYNSKILVDYDDVAQAGPVNLALGFQGDSNGGHFDTILGAFVKVTAYFPVLGAFTVTNPNYSLQTSRTYTPSPPDSVSDSDSFTPASTAIGPSVPLVGSAQAGIDYDIVQNSTHTVSGLNGIARATHQGNGQVRSAPFSLGATDSVLLDLDSPGLWDVELTSLSLNNLFSTDFDLAAVPFAQYTLGGGCGDPGTDSDNGFFCGGDGRLDTTLASLDLFSNTPFALAMQSSNALSSFQITVVPEPAIFNLMGLGLLGVGVVAWRRKTP